MSNTPKNFSGWNIFFRILAFVVSPVWLLLIGLYALLAFLIDCIANKQDADNLSYTDCKKRAVDRSNKRGHKILELIVDYFKFIIFG